MRKKGCAYRNRRWKHDIADVTSYLFNQSCRIIPSVALLLALVLFPLTSTAELLVVKVSLNHEEKGDFFINRSEKGDFLMKTSDLKTIGFRSPSGATLVMEGETYMVLSSMKGVVHTFDEGTLSLVITAPPVALGMETVDFSSKQTQKIYYPRDSSLFLNYNADYVAGNGFSFSNFNLTSQAGARTGDFLFLSDSIFTKNLNGERLIRLQSSLTHDDRKNLQRFIIGDFFTSAADLGSSLNLGGLSFAKVYSIDPYFINYPTLGVSGQTSLPSEAKIYLNGMLLKTERLSPGEFQLQNITPYGTTGALDVILKDAFGREQKLNYPYYFAGSSLLKQGLNEYSYNLGLVRDKYGSRSDRYSNLVFSAIHRYGVSDLLTLGVRAEAKKNLYNLGPLARLRLGNLGLLGISLAGSAGRNGTTGGAGMFSYVFQGLRLGASFSVSGYTRDYENISISRSQEKTKSKINVGLSYSDRLLGTLSLGYTSSTMYKGQNSNIPSIGYTRNLTGEATINATYRMVREKTRDNQFLITLNYTPKSNLFVSSVYQSTKDSRSAAIQVQKNAPVGEGYGYSAILQKTDAAGQSTYTVNPSFQYNGRYGIYQGEFNGGSSSGKLDDQYRLSTSGAFVYVGNTFGVTRPVYDSFGLVSTGELNGVKVFLNSQEIGRTDSSGKLFIPNLGSFNQNQVAISDKEIPIDYHLPSVSKLVSPPLRSGSCIPFAIKKIKPISGKIKIKIDGKNKPIEFQEITITINGAEVTFPTGFGGEFDIDLTQSENFKKMTEAEDNGCNSISASHAFIKPGIYKGTVDYEGKRYHFNLKIPTSIDPVINLEETIVDPASSTY